MPTSSSAGSCCTHCRIASTAFATMASSPMALSAATASALCHRLLDAGDTGACEKPANNRAKGERPLTTADFAICQPTAAVPCGASRLCRAPATLSHSPVTRHDRPADAYRTRPQPCGQQCLHRHRVADQSLAPGMPPVSSPGDYRNAAHSSRRRPHAQTIRRPLAGANHPPTAAATEPLITIPIVPNLPRLRSIQLL